jgi:GYF domain 2
MPSDWYYLADDQVVGPCTAAELQRHFHDGVVRSDTLIRHGKKGDWEPARRYLKHARRRRQRANADRDREPPPLPQQRPAPRRKSEGDKFAESLVQGLAVFFVLVVGAIIFFIVRAQWIDHSSKQPENIIVGRWERFSEGGNRHSGVFYADGIAQFDGQAADMDFMSHVRYKFIDDHTVVFLATDKTLLALREHYSDIRDGRKVVRIGDEVFRITVSFPNSREMKITYVAGNTDTWKKASS